MTVTCIQPTIKCTVFFSICITYKWRENISIRFYFFPNERKKKLTVHWESTNANRPLQCVFNVQFSSFFRIKCELSINIWSHETQMHRIIYYYSFFFFASAYRLQVQLFHRFTRCRSFYKTLFNLFEQIK